MLSFKIEYKLERPNGLITEHHQSRGTQAAAMQAAERHAERMKASLKKPCVIRKVLN